MLNPHPKLSTLVLTGCSEASKDGPPLGAIVEDGTIPFRTQHPATTEQTIQLASCEFPRPQTAFFDVGLMSLIAATISS